MKLFFHFSLHNRFLCSINITIHLLSNSIVRISYTGIEPIYRTMYDRIPLPLSIPFQCPCRSAIFNSLFGEYGQLKRLLWAPQIRDWKERKSNTSWLVTQTQQRPCSPNARPYYHWYNNGQPWSISHFNSSRRSEDFRFLYIYSKWYPSGINYFSKSGSFVVCSQWWYLFELICYTTWKWTWEVGGITIGTLLWCSFYYLL